MKTPERPFDAPWQARSFALCIALHERGLFAWKDWQKALAANIAAHEKGGGAIVSNEDYYQIWQRTLEGMVGEKLESKSSRRKPCLI